MRVLVGLSGGVDSAVAVSYLREAGYTCEGAFLCMHDRADAAPAERAARELSLPLHIVDCRERFRETVIADFISEYRAGRTPNPCLLCNPAVKLRALAEAADTLGIERIATGHYARVRTEGGRFFISCGADARRDQSYVLSRLPQDILSRLLLPLGGLTKGEVRASAQAGSLSSADSPESREICFIPDNDYAGYIERASGRMPEGNFVDSEGGILGRHAGLLHYTVGQRKGLGIALGERMFVSALRPETNEILLLPTALRPEIREFRLISPVCSGVPPLSPGETIAGEIMVRYQARLVPASVTCLADGELRVACDEALPSVTPGQSGVLYRAGDVLLSGFIRV